MSTLLDAHLKGSLPSGLPASALRTPAPPTNPLDAAPSSPQQIYLNLLILEASLRSQYLALTLRRRKYTFFFLLLILWTSYFTHSIFIHGPSPYYYISLLQKLALGAGVMTLAIFWLSGLHKKTLVFPRKFVGNTNKGLRQFNIKLVSVPLTLCERIVGWLVIFPVVKYIWPWCPALPYIPPGELEVEKGRSFGEVLRGFLKHGHHGPPNPAHASPLPPHAQIPTPGRKRRLSQARMPTPPLDRATSTPSTLIPDEEPLQPSGSHVKLVILPKGFSPDFREGWEIYRTEYWEKENEPTLFFEIIRPYTTCSHHHHPAPGPPSTPPYPFTASP
ncbi:hypothetical protein L211DRAFT_843626 [Terfezia boudieri ATCC MYA-4762]|uniref:Spo7-domain-containing protein n=1 Tax=Terfezia boudieri ATCC MYA-4762 TaxID=1051890 RepID=A0A3N4L6C3_9PEZI|nr:hypothetical protein L211DRAFT_843626 [Terfezia boudieri ATCC MYA-4762]